MFSRLLFKVKFRYLFFIFIFGTIINFQVAFFSISFVSLKLYFESKKIIYLILVYIFLTFLIVDLFAPKVFLDKNDYFTSSNIEYDIRKNFGYYPKVNSKFTEKIYFKGNLFKEINYTINKYGHRKTFNLNMQNNDCIAFFGGSIVFGQSLSDNETIPYFVSKKLKGKHTVFNFAFNGYGPHQFLHKIENDNLDELINCKNLKFVYLYIHDHIGRVVGKRSWGEQSPRYILNKEKLYQKDLFSSYPYKLIMKLRKNVRNSKIISTLYDVNKINKNNEYLLVEILKEIEKKIKERYSNSEIIYLVWYKNNLDLEIINNFFKNKKILEIHKLNISEVYQSNNIPGDNHPTKKFNDILSSKLINYFNF